MSLSRLVSRARALPTALPRLSATAVSQVRTLSVSSFARQQYKHQYQQQPQPGSFRWRFFAAAGVVAAAVTAAAAEESSNVAEAKKLAETAQTTKHLLDGKEFVQAHKLAQTRINHNTNLIVLGLPQNAEVVLPTAGYILLRGTVDGKEVVRPYTPIGTTDSPSKYILLVVKRYETGNMSKLINDLPLGSHIDIKAPMTKMPYKANMKKQIAMVAGGTGITPMLQVAETVRRHPEDTTSLSLIFANHTNEDVLLDGALAKTFGPDHVHHAISHVTNTAVTGTVSEGRVNADLLKAKLPPPSDDVLVLVSGPPGFMETVSGPKAKDYTQGELTGALKELGYTKDMVFKM